MSKSKSFGPGAIDAVERHTDPGHLVLGVAELLGDRVGDRRLEALAVVGSSSTNHGSYAGSSVAIVNTPPACVFMSVGLHDAGTTTDSLALDSGEADDSEASDDPDSEDAGDPDDSVADEAAALDSGVDCAVGRRLR